MNAFFKSMIYLIEVFYRTAVMTQVLRDEDVSLIIGVDVMNNPNSRMDKLNVLPLEEVIQNLSNAIGEAKSEELKQYLKAQTALVKFSSIYLDQDAANELFNPTQKEGGKGKKKKKAKVDMDQ